MKSNAELWACVERGRRWVVGRRGETVKGPSICDVSNIFCIAHPLSHVSLASFFAPMSVLGHPFLGGCQVWMVPKTAQETRDMNHLAQISPVLAVSLLLRGVGE